MAENPFEERFEALNENLRNIVIKKKIRNDSESQKLSKQIEEYSKLYSDTMQNYLKSIEQLNQDIVILQRAADSNTKLFDDQYGQYVRKLDLYEQTLQEKIAIEALNRKTNLPELTAYMDEKVVGLQSDMSQLISSRKLVIESLNKSLSHDLPQLQELNLQEKEDRENCDTRILQHSEEEIKHLYDSITFLKNNREESENGIFEMIKNLVNRAKYEIDEEKKRRVQSQNSIVKLLELACTKYVDNE